MIPLPDPACALFLDFDGTLVDIAERPDGVIVEPGLPETLAILRRRFGGALAIVSGRPIAFLDRHLGPDAFDAAGLHGLERRLRGDFQGSRPDDHPGLRTGVADLAALFSADPRIVIEDKGSSVAVHWRQAPEREDEALDGARALAARLGGDYRVQHGKAVAEIVPAAAGKGRVIASFLAEPPYRGREPIFIGDDLTDEHGFEAVNAAGGRSVRIGAGETVATLRLPSPAALRRALQSWAADGRDPFVAQPAEGVLI